MFSVLLPAVFGRWGATGALLGTLLGTLLGKWEKWWEFGGWASSG
jgi:hypothetical protein